MGPLRFELRSEDPQSPRMARLPYGPALLLLAHFIYLSCYGKLDHQESGHFFPQEKNVSEELEFPEKNFHPTPDPGQLSSRTSVSRKKKDMYIWFKSGIMNYIW